MAFNIQKFLKGILIREENTLTPKEIEIIPGGDASTKTTITSSQVSDRVITLPDADDTLVGKLTIDTFSNKTIDLDGFGNTLLNVRDANIASDALIDATKIGGGAVDNVEFAALDGITSNIQSQLDSKASGTDLTNHITDTTGAHAASAISVSPSGNLTSTDAQAALVELQLDVDSKIPLAQKGANNGVATLDAGGKIPSSQLPSTVLEYLGTWDASTNTPTLVDGTGDAGDVYITSVAGTVDFGSGPIAFGIGDWVLYSGTVWQRSANSSDVVSVNGQQGVVVLDSDDIAEGTTNLYYTTAAADLKANVELNNLASTAVNANINPDSDAARDLGSTTLRWNNIRGANLLANGVTRSPIFRPSGTGYATTNSSTINIGTNSFDITTINADVNLNWEVVAPLIFPRGTFINSIVGNTVTTSNNAMITAGLGSALFLAPQLNARSENVTGTDHSGSTWIRSGSSVTGTTGNVNVRSGNSSNGGQTGDVTVATGTTVGTRGRVNIDGKFVNISASAAADPSSPTAKDVYYNTVSNKFRYYNGAIWQDLGSGGSGSGRINYVTNPDAEVDTTGWSTYKDAAQATPVDGTGGTATSVTFTRSTVTPIYGTGSFLFSKSATNGQGEGVSTPITISPADAAQPSDLEISFRVSVSSGTFATGDVVVYVYDVTNSTLITPTNTQINSANNSFFSTFKPVSTSTSYRLIVHVASTSALAYDLKIDAVEVGPQLVTSQQIYSVNPDSSLTLNTSNGVGSTWTRTVRFSNVTQSIGDAVTWTDSAANGSTFTINKAGIYNIAANFRQDLGTNSLALVKNLQSAQQATAPQSVTPAQGRLVVTTSYADSGQSDSGPCVYSGYFDVGDVIRLIVDGTGSSAASNSISIHAKALRL